MPDVGTFAGCHALKQLTLPPQLKMLGAHSFNSSGLTSLTARDAGCENWSRTVTVAVSAFDHTAALLWLEKADVSGHVVARLGLPVARDKILAGDAKFGAILRVPVLFFTQPMPYFDQLARDAFPAGFLGSYGAGSAGSLCRAFPRRPPVVLCSSGAVFRPGSTVHALPGRAGVCRVIPFSLPL